MDDDRHEVTRLLGTVDFSDPEDAERLLALVYGELRTMAARQLRGERPDHTLGPTALVHEAYLRLADAPGIGWESRGHFFGCAARAMRQILVDHARRRGARKRGGGWERLTLDGQVADENAFAADVLDLHAALEKLSRHDEDLASLVELRFFAGLTVDEAARARGVSRRKAAKDWSVVRLWLRRELAGGV